VEEGAHRAAAVDARGLFQFARDLAHELGEDEDRERQVERHVGAEQRPQRVIEAGLLGQQVDRDERHVKRDHQAGDDHNEQRAAQPEANPREHVGRHRADQQNQEHRDGDNQNTIPHVLKERAGGQNLFEGGGGRRFGEREDGSA